MKSLRTRSGSDKMLIQGKWYHRYLQRILLGVAFIVTVFSAMTGSYLQKQDKVQIGSVATQRYVALKDSVDIVETQKQKKEAIESVGPLYKHDEVVQQTSIQEIELYFSELDEILKNLGEEESFMEKVKEGAFQLPIVLNSKQCTAYQNMDDKTRKSFQEECNALIHEIYEQGITDESIEKGWEIAREGYNQSSWSRDLQDLGYLVIKSALKPNLILDKEAMQIAQEKKAAEVQDVVIKKSQKIVDEGEIVTKEIYEKLQALNLIEAEDYRENIVPIVGGLVVIALIFAAVILFFTRSNNKYQLKENEMIMLCTIYVLMTLLMRLFGGVSAYTIAPLSLFAMLVSLLIGLRVALLFNSFMSIIGCFIFQGDAEFLLYFILTGSFAALLIRYTEKRRYVIPVAATMGIVHFLSLFALGLYFENGYSHSLLLAGCYGAASGLISVIIALGSLPFWEAAFEANTPFRLLELMNPNNELLRRLMIEAPGTYHHSLIVANLAETAAYEIGANATLARVGAYYHDVGKLTYPLHFSENQGGENPHDSMEPYSSAQIIIQHIKDGAETGEKQGLPKAVVSIIREHHGNSLVKYFYYKAVKAYGQENVSESDYRYSGPIPQSREAAIVMLADTVEAAVRSVLGSGENLEEAEKLIQTLIKDKLDDGQLNESGLGIQDLITIRDAFLKVFHGMYHNRVAYPKAEEIKKVQQKKEDELESKEVEL